MKFTVMRSDIVTAVQNVSRAGMKKQVEKIAKMLFQQQIFHLLFVFENVYYPASDRIYFYLFAHNGEKMIGKDTEELPPVLTETHFIRAHECGVDGLLKLHVLLDYLQDIALSKCSYGVVRNHSDNRIPKRES